ncbi:TPA: restriction endonuclease subunit S [Clostridium botulinum]|uniref:restriction endonuclease subunit S n=1 Tax=Clostridium sporogenes TaxID=1509 RepID=UPI00330ADC08|nr:restriction endonuclease subunit S [Clostridium botulinum]
MEFVKLGKLCSIITDGTHQTPTYSNEGYVFLSSKNVTSKKIDWNNVKYIPEELHKELSKRLKPQKNDILLAKNGTTGVAALVDRDEVFDIYVSLALLRPNETTYPPYILHVINSPMTKRQFDKSLKGIGVPNLHLKEIKNVTIPVPSIDIQNKIVKVLDKGQSLIDKRKNQIESLDELVKSRFIEMFGDPVSNFKGWEKIEIGNKFEIKTGATPSRKENIYWQDGNIPWVKTTELKEYVITETEEHITEEGFNNSSVNMLPKNTILVAMYGQGKTRGMTGKLGIEATTNQACAAILPNKNENMDFIWYQLILLYNDLRDLGRGGNQPNLNTNLIKGYELIFPPIELQNQFAGFVKQVDKLKFEMQKSLKELEDNFNSLMQKAFKGELFN